MLSITTLQTGSTLVSPAVPDRSTRRLPFAYTGLFQRRSRRIEVPVKCFLVRVGGHRVLVDAGWGADAATHPLRHLGFGLWFASQPVLRTDESPAAQLARMGLSPTDLDAVVLTHLDCDHASGLAELASAPHVLASPEELAHAAAGRDVRYRARLWHGVDLRPLPMRDDPHAPFGRSADVMGDGSLVGYLVPGHSAGSVVYVAREGGRFAVLAGDTGYARESWEEGRLPGPLYDADVMAAGLAWVRELAHDPACVGVFAAHDPSAG